MNDNGVLKNRSQELWTSLAVLKDMGDAGLAVVPREPTVEMLVAGSHIAGLDSATARKLYLAMLDLAP